MLNLRQVVFLVAAGASRHFAFQSKCYRNKLFLSTKHFSIGNVDKNDKRDAYLFGEDGGITFRNLGVCESLAGALEDISKPVATSIQSASYDSIMTGKDCVIGAETGSGKTLAYLVPIFDSLIKDDIALPMHYPAAIVMVPNKELMNQVNKMANELISALKIRGRTLSADSISMSQGEWPFRSSLCPNVLVCTPAFMSSFIRGPNILEEDLYRSVRHLVLDEADMLLDGSYLNDVEKMFDAFKITRRRMIHEGSLEVHSKTLQCILSAATLPTYGKKSLANYVEDRFPLAIKVTNPHMHKHHPRIQQTYIQISGSEFVSDDRLTAICNAIRNQTISSSSTSSSTLTNTITIPLTSTPTLETETILVDPTTSPTMNSIIPKTMVFVNTAEKAKLLTAALRHNNIDCTEFHKLLDSRERETNLRNFRNGNIPVIVCTDHAARGLDISDLKHVIQAEFALNVVQHLHRIGRASRAGAEGRATNIYDDTSYELVDSILSRSDSGAVDQSFSRRRGFRQKIRKQRKRQSESESLMPNEDSIVDDLLLEEEEE